LIVACTAHVAAEAAEVDFITGPCNLSAEVAVEAAKIGPSVILRGVHWCFTASHGAARFASFTQISDAEETYLSRQMTNIRQAG
jgi:hypothetical protein